ncbi:MAG: UvrD-helicase domain-containing protein, partial [Pseudomonadota bacterium]
MQRRAVTHGGGPLLVLAGAGTGKTRVLTRRIAWLVEQGSPPWEVLAVTFTNKAASEMRQRLAQLLGEQSKGMWIGTFHATCARLLRRHGERVGLTPKFVIFDDGDQRKVLGECFKELGLGEKTLLRGVQSRIDRLKNSGVDPSTVPPVDGDAVGNLARRVAPLYAGRLAKEDAVDFNDLILKTLALLSDAEMADTLGRRFSQVLVDEFQDTNAIQYRLVRSLAVRGNLCVVGDDDQSIYRWRGADPRNLLEFDRDYPGAQVVKLEQNYRSVGNILTAANGVISRSTVRRAKKLWTEQVPGDPVLIEETPDEREEAEAVARRVSSMVARGRKWGDIAVLYRMHYQSRSFEEAFRARRIPYRIVGGVSFFQRKEIKDISEYLRLVVNPQADTAFERVVNVPARGIGDTTVERLRTCARRSGISMLQAARELAEPPADRRCLSEAEAEDRASVAGAAGAGIPGAAGAAIGIAGVAGAGIVPESLVEKLLRGTCPGRASGGGNHREPFRRKELRRGSSVEEMSACLPRAGGTRRDSPAIRCRSDTAERRPPDSRLLSDSQEKLRIPGTNSTLVDMGATPAAASALSGVDDSTARADAATAIGTAARRKLATFLELVDDLAAVNAPGIPMAEI